MLWYGARGYMSRMWIGPAAGTRVRFRSCLGPRPLNWLAAGLAALLLTGGCRGVHETAVRSDLRSPSFSLLPATASERAEPGGGLSNRDLPGYVAFALDNHPAVHASFERWRASVHRISKSRKWPEPILSFGYFLQSVETRVGPQQVRVGLQQAFPWPTELTAGADAASSRARAMQRRFEGRALAVAQRVATAYWDLWQVRTTRAIHRRHLEVIRGLSEAVRARMSTGSAMLAELQQIDLAAARLEDDLRSMDEAERGFEARMRAAVGLGQDVPVPTDLGPPDPGVPTETREVLLALARTHPVIQSVGFQAEASAATARAEAAERWPRLTVGVDWLVTGAAPDPSVPDSGQDAVILGAGIRLPLWQGTYADGVAAAEADARAQRAEQQALADRAEAALIASLATLRDTKRRIELYEATLIPQAETAYESVLGAYTVGRGVVSQALRAQEDLLDLRVQFERARAEHARTWARLEELVGRPLPRTDSASRETTP